MDKTSYLIEIEPVHITASKVGNTGDPRVNCFDSQKLGPHEMLMTILLSNTVN